MIRNHQKYMIMKKFIIALTALLTFAVSANAMSYEQARQQALFLTDKMAYELNMTEEQYEAAYEINLDYLMSITSQEDLYGIYWERRNLDLSYILLDWQYRAFVDASYFYRPLYWNAGYWHFGIYARYPHRDYFYFGRPHFYAVYRGGHSWHMNGGRSWYHGRSFGPKPGHERIGMRDGFQRGHYGQGYRNPQTINSGRPGNHQNNGNRTFGSGVNRGTQRPSGFDNNRFGSSSSTRVTATKPNNFNNGSNSTPRSTFTPGRSSSTTSGSSSFGSSARSGSSFGSSVRSGSSFGSSARSGSSFGSGARSGSSFGSGSHHSSAGAHSNSGSSKGSSAFGGRR